MGLKKKRGIDTRITQILSKSHTKRYHKKQTHKKTKEQVGKDTAKKKIILKGWKADNQIKSNSADPRELNSKPMEGKTEVAFFCTREFSYIRLRTWQYQTALAVGVKV